MENPTESPVPAPEVRAANNDELQPVIDSINALPWHPTEIAALKFLVAALNTVAQAGGNTHGGFGGI